MNRGWLHRSLPMGLTRASMYALGALSGSAAIGPVSLRFWSAMRDFPTGMLGRAEAPLLECTAGSVTTRRPARHIRRAGNPAAVRAVTPHGSVTQAPFDDDPGALSDGQTYIANARRQSGRPG